MPMVNSHQWIWNLSSVLASDSRVMDFGSVFLVSSLGNQPAGINIAALVVSRGFGTMIRPRAFEERSNCYDALLAAASCAVNEKKGMHSAKDPPVMHITGLLTASSQQATDFLPFLHRSRKLPAIVEYVFSGHRFKLLIPQETYSIALSFSGVRCPGCDEPYSDEAIAFMRRKILQRDVEIAVDTVDRTGTFLGSLWESKTNMAVALLEAGLAQLQKFGVDRIPNAHLLVQAEPSAKKLRLKVWETYVAGAEVTNGLVSGHKQKDVFQLGGGKFYIHTASAQSVASIQQQLASLSLLDAPVVGAFNPKTGDVVLAQCSADNSWNRAMLVNGPRGAVKTPKDKFAGFSIAYGNPDTMPYSGLRTLDPSVSAAPGLAQLCSLAYIKVPSLAQDLHFAAASGNIELPNCLIRNGIFGSSLKLLSEMKKGGLKPDVVTYSTLLSGCMKATLGYPKALEIIQEKKANALQMDEVIYGTLFAICASNNLVKAAKTFFQQMKDDDLVPNLFRYSSLLHAYSVEGNCDEADKLLQDMHSAGFVPNQVVLTTLLKVYVRGRFFEMSRALLVDLDKLGHAQEEMPSCLLMAGLANAGHIDEARAVFNALRTNVVQYDAYAYSILIFAYCRSHQVDAANQLARELRAAAGGQHFFLAFFPLGQPLDALDATPFSTCTMRPSALSTVNLARASRASFELEGKLVLQEGCDVMRRIGCRVMFGDNS